MSADSNTSGVAQQDPVEEWRDVPGSPGYQISDLGRLRSRHPYRRHQNGEWHIVSGNKLQFSGYWRTSLSNGDGTMRHVMIHWLVLEAFVGPRPNPEMEGCHNDGDKDNNRLDNLRWDTVKGNAADRKKHGTQQLGWSWTSKLTVDDVRLIRRLRRQGVLVKALAERFGIAPVNVTGACGKNWKWLDDAGETYFRINPSKLVSLRTSAGIPRAHLAKAAGIDSAFLFHIEDGTKRPRWRTVESLARSLGVMPEDLCDEVPAAKRAIGSRGSGFGDW